jgi:hypothetical protein
MGYRHCLIDSCLYVGASVGERTVSIEVSARRDAIDIKAENAAHMATTHGTCGASLMIAVNVGMFGIVAAVALAMVEIVAHLVS